MKSLEDFVAKKSLSSDTLSKIASKTRFCSTHAKNPRAIAFGFFILAGHGLELRFPVGNGFSDGKNGANRLALGIKPRTTLKAVFGRVARNTPPGCLRLAYLAPLPSMSVYKSFLIDRHFYLAIPIASAASKSRLQIFCIFQTLPKNKNCCRIDEYS